LEGKIMDKITYLRVYFVLKQHKTAILIRNNKFRPQVVEYPLSSVLYGNKPIETPRFKIIHDSIEHSSNTVIRPILIYEEVTNMENIDIEVRGRKKTVILHEDTKKRILDTVAKWMDANWQELPTHN
jgi:hypothetical protein